MTPLPPAFLGPPIAHRGRHGPGVPENSRAAIHAAILQGYGNEIDLQLSADGQAMVFHDATLNRLTSATGPVRAHTAADLAEIRLSNGEGIPTLAEILSLVAGRAPLLIEIKDQTGNLGPDVGPLEQATGDALSGYDGAVAVMSFNPHAVIAFGKAAPHIALGITSGAFRPDDWPDIPESSLAALRGMPLFETSGAAFVSHNAADLDNPRVLALKARGIPILCWTIRSAAQETEARRGADNITFEGYAAALP